ncbi:hypothetical protein HYT58_00060 [Candidatus Woesearchaeota archaeon]|nr:hypothetical protein [Candidatus Woesearchaeota archaeon]
MFEELEESAKNELKRVDHLIYVTLKYTRTADVIHNTIKRLISAFEYSMLELLEYLIKKKKIKELPKSHRLRADLVKEKIPQLKSEMDFYLLLRRLEESPYKGREEYRKNVTLISEIKLGETHEVNQDLIYKYYERTARFVEAVEEFVKANK